MFKISFIQNIEAPKEENTITYLLESSNETVHIIRRTTGINRKGRK